MMAENTTSVE